MSKQAHCYVVVSAECHARDVILDDGTGPEEYWRDVVYVFARDTRRAKVLALRWFRRQYGRIAWRGRYYLCDENPFKGMKVERYSGDDS